jgi:hypothetical protein
MPCAVSGLVQKPVASGGVAPDLTGHTTCPPRDPAAGTRLSIVSYT